MIEEGGEGGEGGEGIIYKIININITKTLLPSQHYQPLQKIPINVFSDCKCRMPDIPGIDRGHVGLCAIFSDAEDDGGQHGVHAEQRVHNFLPKAQVVAEGPRCRSNLYAYLQNILNLINCILRTSFLRCSRKVGPPMVICLIASNISLTASSHCIFNSKGALLGG